MGISSHKSMSINLNIFKLDLHYFKENVPYIFFIIVHSSQIISINGIDQVAKMQAIEMLIYEDHNLEFLMACFMLPYVGDFRNLYYHVYLNTMRLFHYWTIKIIWKISNPCDYNNLCSLLWTITHFLESKWQQNLCQL